MNDLKGIKKLFELIISEREWILAKAEGKQAGNKEDTRKLGSTTY